MNDLRSAVRSLRRSPAFSFTAVLTLGLTIGAVSTVLTLANALYLRRLPVPNAGKVVEVRATRDEGSRPGLVSYADYVHFRDASRTLHGLASVYPTSPLILSDGDEAREINGSVVSANYFSLLEAEPARGRFFLAEEDQVPDRDRVAVLGYDFWQSRFGGSDAALGSDLVLNDVHFTVVGVAPPALRGTGSSPAQVYLPSMMLGVGYRWCDVLHDPECTILRMVGRLRDGVSVAQANAEMAAHLPARWERAAPGDNSGVRVVMARPTEPGPETANMLRLLAAAGGVLLLVACTNLAGLLLARGISRERELAIRVSLGAAPRRLAGQLTIESLIIAIGGGAVGVVLSLGLVGWLNATFFALDPEGRPQYFDFSLEPRVVAAVVALSALAGLLFGLFPAIRSARMGAAWSMRRTSMAVTSRASVPRWLLASQATFAIALLTTAALLVASARSVVSGANFSPDRVALLRLRPRLVEYSPERAQAFLRKAAERIQSIPDVASLSMVGTGVPLHGFTAEVGSAGGTLTAGYIEVSPRYFETLGTPVLRGREFAESDDASAAPVAVVSEALARIAWPAGDAIGATLDAGGRPHTIIGIVADVPLQHRAEPPRPYVYTPFWQNPEQVDARLQIRVAGDPGQRLPAIVHAVREVDPAVPVTEMSTMPDWLAGEFRQQWISASVIAYSAGLAVVLCAIGLYASLAFAVARRTREIGIRQALGATRTRILTMVVGEGMTAVGLGVVAGVGVAIMAGRLLGHVLYGTAAADVWLSGGAALLVAGVGLLASALPAARAAAVEPVRALKVE